MNQSYSRPLALGGALLLGVLLPQGHQLGFLIRYLVIGMLFIAFLRLHAPHQSVRRSHLFLVLANLAAGPLYWGIARLFTGNNDLALAAFFAGITPTASAATVVMGFLHGRSEYVLISFVLTTIAAALALPFLLPPFLGKEVPGVTGHIFGSMLHLIALPLILAVTVKTFSKPGAALLGRKLAGFSFVLWVMCLFLITAGASNFLRHDRSGALEVLGSCLLISLLACAANFSLGYWLGGREFRREGSQSLGQKNTALTIYLALAYANPVAALGPTGYVLWHNLWNSLQLARVRRQDAEVVLEPMVK